MKPPMKNVAERFTDTIARAIGVEHHHMSAAAGITDFLSDAMQRAGVTSPEELVAKARLEPRVWSALLGVVLNGQTYFYRDPGQIDAIGRVLEQRGAATGRRLRVWCAGCSTGEEPLTLAIECDRRGIDVVIVGTDANATAIGVARAGRYFAWKLRHVQPDIAQDAFVEDSGTFRVRDEVRARVEWAEQNLVRDAEPTLRGVRGGFDLVVCRNVLIYYAADDVARIVRRLLDATAPGGMLALGASELVGDVEGSEIVRVQDRLFLRRAAIRPFVRATPPREPHPPPPRTQPGSVTSAAARSAAALSATPASAAAAPISFLSVEDDVIAMVDAGDLRGAIARLERVAAQAPADALTLLAMAQLQIATHDLAGATQALDLAERIDALDPDVHLARGLLARKLGDWEGARAALQRCLFLDPRSWLASYLCWSALLRVGRDVEADAERGRATRLLADAHAAGRMRSFGPFFARIAPSAQECRAVLEAAPTRSGERSGKRSGEQ